MGGKTQNEKTMITAAIVYDFRKRTPKDKEGPLEARVTINRRSYYIPTGVRVYAHQWAFDKVVNHIHADALNKRLSIIVDKLMAAVNESLESGHDIDIAQIKKNIWSTVQSQTVLDWMDGELLKLGVGIGTYKHYKSVLKRLREYGEIQSWGDVTVNNIYKLDAWLRRLPGRCSRISGGGVYNYHKCIRALLSRAEREELIPFNPYSRMRGVFSKGDRENTEYLTEDEMQLIMNFAPAPGSFMEKARDLFIFQMFTGLSYSDTQAFDISAYKKIDGKWRIVGSRIKTGQPFVNQLLPPAVSVLERNGMEVPKMTNQVYNRELKLVGKAAGITYPLHSHLARHTFATYMLRNGVKIENLAKMLGHANIKQTQRYAKVLAESVHEEFDKIDKMISAAKQ